MSAIASAPTKEFAVPALRARPVVLNKQLLAQIVICVSPAMALVALQRPVWGGFYVALATIFLTAYYVLQRKRYHFLSLTIGCLPVLGLLRAPFFYHGMTLLLLGEIVLWCLMGPDEVKRMWKDPLWRCLVVLCVVYWGASFVYTGDYSSNGRLLDFTFTITGVYLLANKRAYLATALLGIGISATAMALGLLPFGAERLGEAEVAGWHLGNPVDLGMPTALMVLLCFADNGRWLLLENRPILRMAVCIVSGEWLILSGSRGSWLLTIIGFCLIVFFGKQNRKPLFATLGVIFLAAVVLLCTDRGSKIVNQYDRTVDSDRSLAKRTSGRSIQWAAIPAVFAQSPIWGWGPGSGKSVVRLFTGHNLQWHALYIQVIGETGLLGVLPLVILLAILLRRGILHLYRFGEIAPLIGVVSFMTLGLSVQATDALGGIFLGLVFLPMGPIRRYVLGQQMVAVAEESLPVSYEVAT
jgi:O-antigen ligase